MLLTCVSAFNPLGTLVRLALAHSTVSFPFFHLHSQNEGQSLGFEDAFLLKNEIHVTLLVLSHFF